MWEVWMSQGQGGAHVATFDTYEDAVRYQLECCKRGDGSYGVLPADNRAEE